MLYSFLSFPWFPELNLSLFSPPLASTCSTSTFTFFGLLSYSQPADFLSSICSLISVFSGCGLSSGSYRRHTEKRLRPGLTCSSQGTFSTHLSPTCTQRKVSRKGLWRIWTTMLSYWWGNWGPERLGDFPTLSHHLMAAEPPLKPWPQSSLSKVLTTPSRNPHLNFRGQWIKHQDFHCSNSNISRIFLGTNLLPQFCSPIIYTQSVFKPGWHNGTKEHTSSQ